MQSEALLVEAVEGFSGRPFEDRRAVRNLPLAKRRKTEAIMSLKIVFERDPIFIHQRNHLRGGMKPEGAQFVDHLLQRQFLARIIPTGNNLLQGHSRSLRQQVGSITRLR